MNISDGVLEMIADRIDSNIRELEGSLNRVSAYAELNHIRIDEEAVNQALKDIAKVRDPKRITADMIIENVAKYYQVTEEALRGSSRKKEIATARHVAVYLTREMTGMSLPRIGDAFGRDHSTIINSCEKVARLVEDSTEMRDSITDLRKIISEQ